LGAAQGVVEMDNLMYCHLNKKGVKLLKDKEIPLPEEYREVGLPAHKAAFKGDVDALAAIFLEFTEVGVPLEDSYGSNPLHLAARKDDPKTAKYVYGCSVMPFTAGVMVFTLRPCF